MDEFNLASRFARDEDEEETPRRGKIKRLRGRTGVGMEKPAAHDRLIGEGEVDAERGDIFADDMNVRPGVESEDDIDSPRGGFDAPDIDEDDEAFRDLVDRMEGGSASAGRAAAKRAKMKGKRPLPRREEDEEE